MATAANRVEQLHFRQPGQWPEALSGRTRPAVLRGFVEHWPAVAAAERSDDELVKYLLDYSTERPVTVYTGKPGVTGGRIGYLEDFSGFTFDRGRASLIDALAQMQRGEQTVYIGSTGVDAWLPGFGEYNNVAFDGHKPLANFWIGTATDIAAHCDSPQNLACCVSGKRTFTLFAPEEIENLYIGPVDVTPSGRAISLVDFERPDFTRFPKFKSALKRALVAELEPGDALFIPAMWWHRVKSTAALNMLVNYWWKETPDHMGVPDLALEHAILALRGLPPEQKKAWKAMFDYYIFSDSERALEPIPDNRYGMLDPNNEQAARLAWLNFSKKLNR